MRGQRGHRDQNAVRHCDRLTSRLVDGIATDCTGGGATQLSWTSQNSSSCYASGGWSGWKSTTGQATVVPSKSPAEYRLTCCGPGGMKRAVVTVTQSGAMPPVVSLAASPPNVGVGEATQLTWSSTNATSCAASGAWFGTKATNGTESTGPLSGSATYTLDCSGVGGTSSRAVTVTVTQAPTLSLTANPASVPGNRTSTLTWVGSGVDACIASGGWSGSRPTSGSATVGPLTTSTAYTLDCTGAGGAVTRNVAVNVTQPPPASLPLDANPRSMASNGASTLTWIGSGVEACIASGGWSGSRSISGSATAGPITVDTTYTLSCTGTGGNAIAMTAVVIRDARVAWQAPTTNTDGSPITGLTGYKVYYGTSPGVYTQSVTVDDATTLQTVFALPADGSWYFVVTAINASGRESASSPEVTLTLP